MTNYRATNHKANWPQLTKTEPQWDHNDRSHMDDKDEQRRLLVSIGFCHGLCCPFISRRFPVSFDFVPALQSSVLAISICSFYSLSSPTIHLLHRLLSLLCHWGQLVAPLWSVCGLIVAIRHTPLLSTAVSYLFNITLCFSQALYNTVTKCWRIILLFFIYKHSNIVNNTAELSTVHQDLCNCNICSPIQTATVVSADRFSRG